MTEVSSVAAGDGLLLGDGGQSAIGARTETDQKSVRWEAEELAAGRRLAEPRAGGAFVQLFGIAVSLLAGMGLRVHVPHPTVAVIAVIAVLAVLTIAQEAAVLVGRFSVEPGWARDMDRYRRSLSSRQPPESRASRAAADYYLDKVTGWRWQSAHLVIVRRPPGTPWIPMAQTDERGSRLVFFVGEHVFGEPAVLTATLAHETRHMNGWRRFLRLVYVTARNRGYLVIGWALPWPDVLWAALILHLALILISWIIEISCDLGAAADTGPEAMTAVFAVMARSAAGAAAGEPGLSRAAGRAVFWAAGPEHPPIPVRHALTQAYCRLRLRRQYPKVPKQPAAKT